MRDCKFKSQVRIPLETCLYGTIMFCYILPTEYGMDRSELEIKLVAIQIAGRRVTYGPLRYKPLTRARQSPSLSKTPIQGIERRGNPQQGKWSNKSKKIPLPTSPPVNKFLQTHDKIIFFQPFPITTTRPTHFTRETWPT